MTPSELASIANDLRISIIDMLEEARSGHPGGSLSAIDVLTVLWFHEMKGTDPRNQNGERDRFILSKGHAVPALYAVLARKGFFDPQTLKTLRKMGSALQGHPDRVRLPILEASTGSLGQGLSVAQGLALGFRQSGAPTRVFCMIGDGESQEGQIWEAAMSAPKFQLSNLCVIQDNNKGQIDGPVSQVMPLDPIAAKWAAFGWDVMEIDGHDFSQIIEAFRKARQAQENGSKKPVYILAQTVKGKGVSFMEGKIEWHGTAPNAEQAKLARQELLQLTQQRGGTHG